MSQTVNELRNEMFDNLDVGVEQDVIAFNVTGTIRDLDDDFLDALTDTTLRPTETHFTTDD